MLAAAASELTAVVTSHGEPGPEEGLPSVTMHSETTLACSCVGGGESEGVRGASFEDRLRRRRRRKLSIISSRDEIKAWRKMH